jgi:hypothetical protein
MMIDMSCNGIGGILNQDSWEKICQTIEETYSATRRELIAILWEYSQSRLICGEEVIIVTNHKALTWMLKLMIPVHKSWN